MEVNVSKKRNYARDEMERLLKKTTILCSIPHLINQVTVLPQSEFE